MQGPWILLLAQGVDTIGGSSGWVGAGLLGLILGWLLLRHLPSKDAQIKDFMETKDAQVKELILAKDEQIRVLSERYERKVDGLILAFQIESTDSKKEFRQALDLVLAHCDREAAKMVDAFRVEIARVVQARGSGDERA